ncbi:hypothetical protein AALP_AAs53681U000100 [Arabis alpina]|uniref:Uncharacterized protein n=1 Tax=Arabis alpina TaxID=50452 RepID=A0A087FYR9_ARAAL|nr:hypothetical protein AALP_AAs53681U000100 [Arabis alpina]
MKKLRVHLIETLLFRALSWLVTGRFSRLILRGTKTYMLDYRLLLPQPFFKQILVSNCLSGGFKCSSGKIMVGAREIDELWADGKAVPEAEGTTPSSITQTLKPAEGGLR